MSDGLVIVLAYRATEYHSSASESPRPILRSMTATVRWTMEPSCDLVQHLRRQRTGTTDMHMIGSCASANLKGQPGKAPVAPPVAAFATAGHDA